MYNADTEEELTENPTITEQPLNLVLRQKDTNAVPVVWNDIDYETINIVENGASTYSLALNSEFDTIIRDFNGNLANNGNISTQFQVFYGDNVVGNLLANNFEISTNDDNITAEIEITGDNQD
jgi:hypothetical protein